MLISLLAGIALTTPVQAAPLTRTFQPISTRNVASPALSLAVGPADLSSSPGRFATLNQSVNFWIRASSTSVSNVLVADPSLFSYGQAWDLGEGVFHTIAETTNFTPLDDPDFSAIASLLTDGINEYVELDSSLPGGGGTGMTAWESYWLNRNPDLVGTDVDFIRHVIQDLSMTPSDGGTQVFENYTWEIWGHLTFVAFYPPTDPNGTYLIDRRYTNVNVTLAEPGIASLEWNGANLTMIGGGTNWQLNVSDLSNGVYTYRVWATNSSGAVFASHVRRLTVGVGLWALRHAATGLYPSIAYDANGSLRLCFWGAGIGGMYGLIYGSFDSNGWQFTQVDATSGSSGESCSIALDRAGRPHISYLWGPDYNSNFYVRYAAFDGTSWNLETIDHGYYTYTSIALDPGTDLPRIAYSPYSGGLRLAAFNGTGWTTETIDPSADGASVSLAIDPNGDPRIAYGGWAANALRYARWTGSEWNISVVDNGAYTASLKLDTTGGPHVAYLTRTGLKYASLNGMVWSNETVDVKTFSSVALALDAQDAPHIAYSGGWGGDVRYAVNNGTWAIQVVSHHSAGYPLAMTMGPGDTPGIVFQTNLSNGDLAYATTGPDTIPPVTAIQLSGIPGAGGWFQSSVRVTLVATDDVGGQNTTYRVESGLWQRYAGPFARSGDGAHTVDYYSP